MAETRPQILVKTPLTTNGTDPILDSEGKRVFSESIMMATARPILEKRNQGLAQHLRVIIEDYVPPATPATQPQAAVQESAEPVKQPQAAIAEPVAQKQTAKQVTA